MSSDQLERPAYAITSVDHALRVVTMLQLEGQLTVAEVADRLNVARSTAHRILAMLVYRGFAVRTDERAYRSGSVLDLSGHSQEAATRLRTVALPHMRALTESLGESTNLIVRVCDTARFLASVAGTRQGTIGDREGMVFPAHKTTGGLLALADLSSGQVEAIYARPDVEHFFVRRNLDRLRTELARVRANGFAINCGRSEHGIMAVGQPVRSKNGDVLAGLSVCMPSRRFDVRKLPELVAALKPAVAAIEASF